MIRVIGDRVLVALPPKEHAQEAATGYTYQQGVTTASGLILAKPADVYNVDLATRGIVMALGEKSGMVDIDEAVEALREFVCDRNCIECDVADVEYALSALKPAPFDVAVGDCVVFPPSAGDQIRADGVDYVILSEHEIIGIVEPFTKETA